MSMPVETDILVCRDLARLAAAGLQVPEFLVLAEGSEAAPRWLDASLVPVAGHWQATSCDEALLPEAVDLVAGIAVIMDRILDTFMGLRARATMTSQQRKWLGWEIRRQVIVCWLGQTGPHELNEAARTWRRLQCIPGEPAGDVAVEWQAWDLIHSAPSLSTLRASLIHHMAHYELPPDDAEQRICGMRPSGG